MQLLCILSTHKNIDIEYPQWYNIIIKTNNHKKIKRKVITMKNISETMKELAEMTELLEETKSIIESLQDEVKNYMTENNVDEVLSDDGAKATWRMVISSRFDSTAFKKDFLDIYKEYTKKTSYRRFTFNR